MDEEAVISCPKCGNEMLVGVDQKSGKCPYCGARFKKKSRSEIAWERRKARKKEERERRDKAAETARLAERHKEAARAAAARERTREYAEAARLSERDTEGGETEAPQRLASRTSGEREAAPPRESLFTRHMRECQGCGKSIWASVEKCPQCGAPKPTHPVVWIIAVLFLILVGWVCTTLDTSPSPSIPTVTPQRRDLEEVRKALREQYPDIDRYAPELMHGDPDKVIDALDAYRREYYPDE